MKANRCTHLDRLYFRPLSPPLSFFPFEARECLLKQIRLYCLKLKCAKRWLILTTATSFFSTILFFYYRLIRSALLGRELQSCASSCRRWVFKVFPRVNSPVSPLSGLQGELQHDQQHRRDRLQRHLLHLGRERGGQGTEG